MLRLSDADGYCSQKPPVQPHGISDSELVKKEPVKLMN